MSAIYPPPVWIYSHCIDPFLHTHPLQNTTSNTNTNTNTNTNANTNGSTLISLPLFCRLIFSQIQIQIQIPTQIQIQMDLLSLYCAFSANLYFAKYKYIYKYKFKWVYSHCIAFSADSSLPTTAIFLSLSPKRWSLNGWSIQFKKRAILYIVLSDHLANIYCDRSQ